MLRRTVTAPDGTKWKLGRRWLPRWKQLARADPGDFSPDMPDFGRVVLRKPWTVYAKSRRLTHERQVVGWRDSRLLIADMATRLSSGVELEPAPRHGR
jgi:hypothetical protein